MAMHLVYSQLSASCNVERPIISSDLIFRKFYTNKKMLPGWTFLVCLILYSLVHQ